MGAYEFQGVFDAWLAAYGLPTDGSADFADPDHDGLNNWGEYEADTDPTNAASVLRITSVSGGPAVTVTVQSSAARLYTLQSSSDLANALWAAVPGATDIPGADDALFLTDPDATAAKFYHVSVRQP